MVGARAKCSFQLFLAVVATWQFVFLGTRARADEPVPTTAEVVVTAKRPDPKPVSHVPNSTPISLSGVAAGTARTLPEALAADVRVMVQKTAHGQGSPFLRGFTGFRTLLLVDNIRLNHAAMRDGPNQYWNTVDGYGLERLEVVSGAAAVRYGSGAIGGVVNAVPLGVPEDLAGANFGGRVLYRFGGAERSHSERLDLWQRSGAVAARVGVSLKHFGDLEAAKLGRLRETGYREMDVDSRLVWEFGPSVSLVVGAQHVKQDDVPRTHKTVDSVSWRGTTSGSDLRRDLYQQRDLVYAKLVGEDDGFLGASASEVRVSWQRHEESQRRRRSDQRFEVQRFVVNALGVGGTFEYALPIGTLTWGADWTHDIVGSSKLRWAASGALQSESIQGVVGDNATYDVGGAFVEQRIELGAETAVTLGARYTYAAADADKIEDPVSGGFMGLSDHWHDVSGSVRFETELAGFVVPFVELSQGFRAPNLSDLTRLDDARSGELETPSPGLDPERFVTLEVGANLEGVLGELRVVGFWTWIDGMVVRQPTGNVVGGDLEVRKRNAGRGYVAGVEADAKWILGSGWEAFGGFSWLEGEIDTYPSSSPRKEREVFDRLMPAQGVVGARYTSYDKDVSAEGGLRMVRHQHRLSTRDRLDTDRIPAGGTPGYAVAYVRGSWRPAEWVRLFGGVENLADVAYRVHGSGQNEPGTNVVIGAELRF